MPTFLKNALATLATASLLALALISASHAQSAEPFKFGNKAASVSLPTAATGLQWRRIASVDLALQIPSTWKEHSSQIPSGGLTGRVLGFTDTALNADGSFNRGLLVRVLWPDEQATDVQVAAQGNFDLLVNSFEGQEETTLVLDKGIVQKGDKTVATIKIRNTSDKDSPFIAQSLFIVAPKSGVVYQFLFIAPENEWEKAWNIGKVTMNNVFIGFPGE